VAHQGTATLDFGDTPADEASVDVTGQTGILSTSDAEAYFMVDSTADNGTDEHQEGAALCKLVCGNIVAGTGFTIYAHCLAMLGVGQFKVRWVWN
jgi:hypothetical protein